MHCPQCGQQQISDETRFCSRCGFLLTGVAEVVANNGLIPAQKTGLVGSSGSKKRRGIMQGAFLFLITFIIVPILITVSIALDIEPFLPLSALFLFGGGGLLRIVYALMFEEGAPSGRNFAPPALPVTADRPALQESRSIPASAYVSPSAGSWRDTNDLQRQAGSVTDSTTKLLERDDQ